MAKSITGLVRSHLADNTIFKNQLLKLTSTGVDVATAATDKIIGVAMVNAAAADQVSVQMTGTAKVLASTAITKGAWVTATTGGKAVTTTTDHHFVLGIALETVAADGDLLEIQLMQGTLSA